MYTFWYSGQHNDIWVQVEYTVHLHISTCSTYIPHNIHIHIYIYIRIQMNINGIQSWLPVISLYFLLPLSPTFDFPISPLAFSSFSAAKKTCLYRTSENILRFYSIYITTSYGRCLAPERWNIDRRRKEPSAFIFGSITRLIYVLEMIYIYILFYISTICWDDKPG